MATNETFGATVRRIRHERGLSQAELARATGTSQQSINRIENDHVRSSRWVGVIADYLGIDRAIAPKDIRSTAPAPNASPPVPVDYPKSRIPMLGAGSGGTDGRFVLNGSRVLEALCPPQLVGVPDAYGVFVHGTSMEPRYHPGEAVFVNPHLPVRQGDYVVVQIASDDGSDELDGYIKRFVSMNANDLVLEQYKRRDDTAPDKPDRERYLLRFSRPQVYAVHKIVASGIV